MSRKDHEPGGPTSLRQRLAGWPQRLLLKSACLITIAAAFVMGASVVSPKPLWVISAMSVGHVLCAAGLFCFVSAILVEMATRPGLRPSIGPPPPAPEEEGQAATSDGDGH
jgi:hypothetical protein